MSDDDLTREAALRRLQKVVDESMDSTRGKIVPALRKIADTANAAADAIENREDEKGTELISDLILQVLPIILADMKAHVLIAEVMTGGDDNDTPSRREPIQ